MNKYGLLLGLWGAASVALGAFGAHALEEFLNEAGTKDTWETATFYQLTHAVAALSWMLSGRKNGPMLCWLWGSVIFSSSLYGLALEGPRWLGPLTPIGGLIMLIGWVWASIALAIDQNRSSEEQN